MIRAALLAAPAAALSLLAACTAGESYREEDEDLRVVQTMDISRYAGRWYEIARFPNRFEKNCAGATHDYDTRSDGRFDVRITCRIATLAGPVRTFEGTARSVAPPDGALKISFNEWLPWFFDGDYMILAVSPDYDTAVVGDPEGTVGWILARDIAMADEDLRAAYDVLWRNGYDLEEIYLVDQPGVGN